MDNYYEIPKVSNSSLSHFAKSPAHYQHYVLNGMSDTPSMKFGRLYHMAILEREMVKENYIVFNDAKRPNPKMTMAANVNKEWKAQIESEAEKTGKELISKDDADKVNAMFKVIFADPYAREMIQAKGETEKAYFWTDEETGIEMKCKVDKEYLPIVPDLKTTTDASPENFPRTCFKYGYHRQAAIYLDGTGGTKYRIIAQETAPPYAVTIFQPSEDFIWQGRMEYKGLLADLKICRERFGSEYDPENVWPGYGWKASAFELDLPRWAQMDKD